MCGNDCNCWWIIILIVLFFVLCNGCGCGNNNGCGCGNNGCGC